MLSSIDQPASCPSSDFSMVRSATRQQDRVLSYDCVCLPPNSEIAINYVHHRFKMTASHVQHTIKYQPHIFHLSFKYVYRIIKNRWTLLPTFQPCLEVLRLEVWDPLGSTCFVTWTRNMSCYDQIIIKSCYWGIPYRLSMWASMPISSILLCLCGSLVALYLSCWVIFPLCINYTTSTKTTDSTDLLVVVSMLREGGVTINHHYPSIMGCLVYIITTSPSSIKHWPSRGP